MKFTLLAISFLALINFANAGPDVTGGGDAVVMKFQLAGSKFCAYIKNSKTPNEFPFASRELCEAVEKVKVSVEERVFLADGTEVDALNIPSLQQIKLSLKRNTTKPDMDFFSLAIHEYISIIGVNDKNYAVSGSIFMRMDLNEGDLDIPVEGSPDIEADYLCEVSPDDFGLPGTGLPGDRTLRISLLKGVLNYRPTQMSKQPAPQAADGKEKTISYEKYSTHDAIHEEYRTITPIVGGFKIEGRNTNFGCTGLNGPDYRCNLHSWGISYQRYQFSEANSVLTFFYKYVATSLRGRVSTIQAQSSCRKI